MSTFHKSWQRGIDWIAIFIQAPNAEMMSASQDEARMLLRRLAPSRLQRSPTISLSSAPIPSWPSGNDLTGNPRLRGHGPRQAFFLVVGGNRHHEHHARQRQPSALVK